MTKVFLVDDEIAIRENLRNSFPWEAKGYQLIGEAPDGEMALPMLRDLNADSLLTDIRMPFMDGIRLCEEVQRTMPWVERIILSGYDDFTYARKAISLGVKEYLLSVGRVSIVSIRIVVVLPAPFGPKSPKISPVSMVSERPSTATFSAFLFCASVCGNVFRRLRISIMRLPPPPTTPATARKCPAN